MNSDEVVLSSTSETVVAQAENALFVVVDLFELLDQASVLLKPLLLSVQIYWWIVIVSVMLAVGTPRGLQP